MSDLLSSLKSDLLDRRLLPFLGLLGLLLAAAVAYAVLGGSSGSSTPSAATVVVRPKASGSSLAVSQAPENPHAAVAETTNGASYQHRGGAHDPFTALAAPKSEAGAGSSSSSSATSSTSSAASSPSSSGGGTTSTTPTPPSTSTTPAAPAPTKKPKPQPVYLVDVLFGLAPTTPGQLSQLTPYANLKRLEPLPSPSEPRVVFAGVTSGGKGALFALAGEAILQGEGVCVPSATQCEGIDLAIGKSEELSYLQASGQTVSYELKLVSIAKREASAARAARLNRRDRAGEALIHRLAPAILHHLRFSAAKSVLVYVARHGA
jgi:hypothetical protein